MSSVVRFMQSSIFKWLSLQLAQRKGSLPPGAIQKIIIGYMYTLNMYNYYYIIFAYAMNSGAATASGMVIS